MRYSRNSTAATRRASTLLLVLGMTSCLAACQTTLGSVLTPTSAKAEKTVAAQADDLCTRAWKPITYSRKNDSAQTVLEIRANNAARDAYCSAPKPGV